MSPSRLLPASLLFLVIVAGGLSARPAARRDDPKPGPVAAAKKQYERDAEALRAKLRRAQTTADKDKIAAQLDVLKTKFLAKLVALAEDRPADRETFPLLVELAELGGETGPRARGLIAAHHAAKPWVGPALPVLARADDASDALAAVYAKNPDRAARGQAAYFLGTHLKRRAAAADGEPQKAHLAAAGKALAAAAGEYADVKLGPGEKVGRAAAAALAGLPNVPFLAAGRTAPELAGDDTDGKPLKLSEFRGKVVMLDFWATWCGPCMKLVPHNKKLVEAYSGRPFALLGVCADDDAPARDAAAKRHGINWRSVVNAPPAGPSVTDRWNVESLPTVYLIDHAGVIRKIWEALPDTGELDREIETLVAAAEKK